MINNYKGVSLVALVITIVVLLILAGITISFTVGSDGILTKAQNAKNLTNMSQAKENVELIIANLQIENNGKSGIEDLKNYANAENSDIKYNSISNKFTYKDKYTISIDDNLKITNFEEINNTNSSTINKVNPPMVFDTFEREQ